MQLVTLKLSSFSKKLWTSTLRQRTSPFLSDQYARRGGMERCRIPGLASLAEESRLAGEVKKQTPILLIWASSLTQDNSSNRGEWIRGLIEDYKTIDGKPLGERNLKWLQDDYVKFLRFAQWKIEQAGQGIVGMITNHSYLENQTFRGMRRSLMKSYDDIFILNLHGSSQRPESVPDGCMNQNIFDIQQGVAIAFFVKRRRQQDGDARVYYSDNWGRRKDKYIWLSSHYLADTVQRYIRRETTCRSQDERLSMVSSFFLPCIFPLIALACDSRDRLTIHLRTEWETIVPFGICRLVGSRRYQLGDMRGLESYFAQRILLVLDLLAIKSSRFCIDPLTKGIPTTLDGPAGSSVGRVPKS